MQKWVHSIYSLMTEELYIFQIDVRETEKRYVLETDKKEERLSFNGKRNTVDALMGYTSRYPKSDRFSDTYEEARTKLRDQLEARREVAQRQLEHVEDLIETFNSVAYVKQ